MGALRTGPGGDVCNRRDHVVEPRPASPLGSAGPASFGISSPPLGAVSRQTSSERSAKATWYSDRFLVPACAYRQGLAPTSLRALFVAVDNRFPHSQY